MPVLEKNILTEAEYIITTQATVREAAKHFNISKSTLHRHLSVLLPEISLILSDKVQEIFDYHTSIRHINGGMATKKKYEQQLIKTLSS